METWCPSIAIISWRGVVEAVKPPKPTLGTEIATRIGKTMQLRFGGDVGNLL
jgi:hypothetical protein